MVPRYGPGIHKQHNNADLILIINFIETAVKYCIEQHEGLKVSSLMHVFEYIKITKSKKIDT